MLSHCLREIRTQLETASFRSGEIVELSADDMRAFIGALIICEQTSRRMEKKLAASPAQETGSCEIVSFPTPAFKRPQLTIVHGDGGGAA